jgi:Flp pilus assembly protein TadD
LGRHLYSVVFVVGIALFALAFAAGAIYALAHGGPPGIGVLHPLAIARTFLDRGDVAGAAREYRTAALVDPSNVATLDEYAGAMARGGNPASELEALTTARTMRPLDSRVHADLGATLLRLGRFADALVSFDLAMRLAGPTWVTLAGRGDAARGLGRLDEAADAYARALEMEPASAALHNKLGITRALEGRRSDALEQWRIALRLDPSQQEARENIARLEAP